MELPGETGSRLESGTAPATVSETVRFSRTVCGLMPLHDVWEGAAKVPFIIWIIRKSGDRPRVRSYRVAEGNLGLWIPPGPSLAAQCRRGCALRRN